MDLFSSVITGGFSGLLGTALSGAMGYLQTRQRHKQALEMRSVDIEEMRLEAETAQKRAALELEARTSEADSEALQASYRAASTRWTEGMTVSSGQSWVLVFIDMVRGLMRPALTLLYLYGTYAVWRSLAPGSEESMHVAHAMIYLATTSTLWWFGSRHVEKAMGRHGGG